MRGDHSSRLNVSPVTYHNANSPAAILYTNRMKTYSIYGNP